MLITPEDTSCPTEDALVHHFYRLGFKSGWTVLGRHEPAPHASGTGPSLDMKKGWCADHTYFSDINPSYTLTQAAAHGCGATYFPSAALIGQCVSDTY